MYTVLKKYQMYVYMKQFITLIIQYDACIVTHLLLTNMCAPKISPHIVSRLVH